MTKSAIATAVGLSLAITGPSALAATLTTDVSVVANDAAGLQPDIDGFRTALGDNNGNNPVNADPEGRRQIDWDAAPDVISDPNAFPGNFFNGEAFPRARGIEFRETGDTEGFLLSATAASGEGVRFGAPDQFVPFSEERLFAPVGGTTLDVLFFDPATQVDPALSRGLGIIFSDVEVADLTTVTLFDFDGNELASRSATPGASGGLSFIGLIFDEPVIARASITAGEVSIDDPLAFLEEPTSGDVVVMDDFIFGEPVPVAGIAPIPLPATLPLALAGLAAFFAVSRHRVT